MSSFQCLRPDRAQGARAQLFSATRRTAFKRHPRSCERTTTKGGHVATLPIDPQLRPRGRGVRLRVHVSALEREGAHDSHQHGPAHARNLHTCRAARGLRDHCRRCKRKAPHVERQHPDDQERRCPVRRAALGDGHRSADALHDVRHTYGTLLAQAGFNGVRLQRAMRHRDFKMTARYVHTNVEGLRAAAAYLPPSGRLSSNYRLSKVPSRCSPMQLRLTISLYPCCIAPRAARRRGRVP
jgi:hypothetical protein